MIGPSSTAAEVIAYLRSMRSEETIAGLARHGIVTDNALGIGNSALRQIAKVIRADEARAKNLWASGIREARLLAIWTFVPTLLSPEDIWRLADEFNSWEIVDAAADLLTETPGWRKLVEDFAADDRELIRRTAFAMIAGATVHNRDEPDATFLEWLPLIERHATDPRNLVKKAVNWALRNTGKRSRACHTAAVRSAEKLAGESDPTARWIGKNALRELRDPERIAELK